MARFKYRNCNPFPIYLPAPGGVNMLFRPGEETTNPWFSRFCGPRQLAKYSVDMKIADVRRKAIPSSKIIKGIVEEEVREWVRKNGIYYCKLCDMFRSGSRTLMNSHLEIYHKQIITPVPIVKEPEPIVEEIVEEGIKTAESVVEDTSIVEGVNKKSDIGMESTIDECTCEYCGKRFKNITGLRVHVTRMHSNISSVGEIINIAGV